MLEKTGTTILLGTSLLLYTAHGFTASDGDLMYRRTLNDRTRIFLHFTLMTIDCGLRWRSGGGRQGGTTPLLSLDDGGGEWKVRLGVGVRVRVRVGVGSCDLL